MPVRLPMPVRLVFAACLVTALATPAIAQVQKKEIAGIRNYSRVDATVGCGGATSPAAMAALKSEGYVSVINLRLANEEGADVEGERAAAQTAGIKYIHLPFNGAAPDPNIVEQFLSAVANKQNQPVYIHCGSANRVGAVWAIKRVLQDKWALDRAMAEGEAIGLTSSQLKKFATEYIAAHR